ncbi:hypothetical protein Taro_018637 [Colocasia esculenta]|uniref:Aminotransferase-like plant mobile domain-containing protein n=1 Tax=Colocasia esculenta TaxID=4460 RepID=A0A843UJ70_COLES|nr:hypothetical protein [Colocasia esculenta]
MEGDYGDFVAGGGRPFYLSRVNTFTPSRIFFHKQYQQLRLKNRRRGRYLYASENEGWNPCDLPDRTYLVVYLVYWLATFAIPHDEESIRPGLIYPACLLAEGYKLAIAPTALTNMFHGLGTLTSHPSPWDRKTQMATHYLSAWAAIFAFEVAGDRSDDPHLDIPSSSRRKRVGKSGITDSTPSHGSSASDSETDGGADDSVAPDDYNPLSGDSHTFHGRKCETSSRAAEVFLPEAEDDQDPQPFDRTCELPPHNSFFRTAAIEGDNTTFSFVELGLPTESYPPTTVEAYIPVAVGEFPARGPVPEGNSPHLNNSGSSPIELATFPGHGVEWSTGVQPTSLPLGNGFLRSIFERVRVVVRAEDPPSIEAVRHALEQNTIAALYMGLSRDS